MSPARRSIRRRDWPRGLREPRPGYYSWDHPDGRSFAIGRVPLAVAKNEAMLANQKVSDDKPGLLERIAGGANTVGDLIDAMPAPDNKNTAKSARSLDKIIREAIGSVPVQDLTVRQCADLIEDLTLEGKQRTAAAVRSRLSTLCRKGMAKGWMEFNPAEVTERPKAAVKRGRLTLEAFRAIHAKAPEVSEWLQHAMMLALVSGQDRSTVAAMERQHVKDGHLITWRTKTRDTNQPVAIPLRLRLDAVGVTLSDLVAHRTGVVSRYLVHHVNPWGNAPAGSPVFPDRISKAFTEARKLAGIPDEGPDGRGAPTFHEIRSLSKRLYTAQGNVDTKTLLSHNSDDAAALYADPRGVEPVYVRVG